MISLSLHGVSLTSQFFRCRGCRGPLLLARWKSGHFPQLLSKGVHLILHLFSFSAVELRTFDAAFVKGCASSFTFVFLFCGETQDICYRVCI